MSDEKSDAHSDTRSDTKIDTKPAVEDKYADVTHEFLAAHASVPPITSDEEKALRRKLYWRVMGLLSVLNIVLFVRIRANVAPGICGTSANSRSTRASTVTPQFWACLRKPRSRKDNIT